MEALRAALRVLTLPACADAVPSALLNCAEVCSSGRGGGFSDHIDDSRIIHSAIGPAAFGAPTTAERAGGAAARAMSPRSGAIGRHSGEFERPHTRRIAVVLRFLRRSAWALSVGTIMRTPPSWTECGGMQVPMTFGPNYRIHRGPRDRASAGFSLPGWCRSACRLLRPKNSNDSFDK